MIKWRYIKDYNNGLRKITRKISMRQIKSAILVVIISCFLITLLLYYLYNITLFKGYADTSNFQKSIVSATKRNFFGTPFQHKPLNEIYRDRDKHEKDYSIELEDHRPAQMLNTPGCQIPLSMVSYDSYMKSNTGEKSKSGDCGRRIVYLKKNNLKFRVQINDRLIRESLKKGDDYYCCYRYFNIQLDPTHRSVKTENNPCTKIQNGEEYVLEFEFINVLCFVNDTLETIYEDVYALTKRINITEQTKANRSCKIKYNVLMIGMDSMSLPRFVNTMPDTANYFKENFWLGFRGYHKIGDNTFPNLMAAFTGQNLSDINKKCLNRMDNCNDRLIWSTFKEAGYVTAYGEDYLRLPDTFSNAYSFHRPPTHHYIRPFFVNHEIEKNNRSLVCAGKLSSAQHLLDYALDFAVTYKYTSFFGLFWINSYSHNINSRPQDADKMLENFFNRLSYTGALANTFVIFFSDHGIRFGDHRAKIESYYDERMPILFFFPPITFKWKHPKEYKNLAINQFRLTTHYDLFNTLQDINRISNCRNSTSISVGCPKCQSLFNVVSANRTCQDVSIHDKWCSCHKLYPLDIEDTEGMKSVRFVVQYIISMAKSTKTKKCWTCADLSLKNVTRMHFYYDGAKIKLFYVVAITMSPGNTSYEATVSRTGSEIKLVGPVSIISPYRGLGNCAVQRVNDPRSRDRLFCVCQKLDNCRINSLI